MGIGDLVCQGLEQRTEVSTWSWNADRSRIMTAAGFFVSAPWSHIQYQLFERFVPGNLGFAVAKKVALSALLAPVSISLLFASVLVLQGKSENVADKLSKDVIPTWQVGALYWPLVLSVNFRYVPTRHRPLVAALFGSVWSVYSAYMANKKEDPSATILLLEDDVESAGMMIEQKKL